MCRRTSTHRSKKPCQVIGLTECEAETEALLQASPGEEDRPWETRTLDSRAAYPYYTIRPEQGVGVLLGVRTAVAEDLHVLNWTRKEEGTYNSKPLKKKSRAYTRTLIAKITLKNHVGFLGKELRVAVCHLHFQVANNSPGFRNKNIRISGHGWQTS